MRDFTDLQVFLLRTATRFYGQLRITTGELRVGNAAVALAHKGLATKLEPGVYELTPLGVRLRNQFLYPESV